MATVCIGPLLSTYSVGRVSSTAIVHFVLFDQFFCRLTIRSVSQMQPAASTMTKAGETMLMPAFYPGGLGTASNGSERCNWPVIQRDKTPVEFNRQSPGD